MVSPKLGSCNFVAKKKPKQDGPYTPPIFSFDDIKKDIQSCFKGLFGPPDRGMVALWRRVRSGVPCGRVHL